MKNLVFILMLSVAVFSTGCVESVSKKGNGPAVDGLMDEAIKVVGGALASDDGLVRSRAVEVVATSNSRRLMPMVVDLLRDEFIPVRFAAALAVGDVGYKRGQKPLKPLLKDGDENVAIAAAYALAKLGNKAHVDMIRNAMKSHDQTVRANAALLLGKLGSKREVKLLYAAISDPDSKDKVKLQVIEAIAMLGDRKIFKHKLWPLLISIHPDDKIMGIKSMGALGTEEAANAIMTMLNDDYVEVRLAAAHELGRLGNTAGEAEVLAYLSKSSADTAGASVAETMATMAIGRIGTDSLTKFLPKLLRSRSMSIRLSAAQSVLLLAD